MLLLKKRGKRHSALPGDGETGARFVSRGLERRDVGSPYLEPRKK